MRVLVCGGRAFANWEWLERSLDALHRQYQFTVLIHGASRGADALAERWAFHHRLDIEKYPAMWKKHGNKKAGPIRNSAAVEALTSVLIAINRRYKVAGAGIRITGIAKK